MLIYELLAAIALAAAGPVAGADSTGPAASSWLAAGPEGPRHERTDATHEDQRQGDGRDDSIAVRVQACTACHGEQGRATSHGYFPRIAGKPAGYLYAQLLNFRDGRRNNALMSGLVQNLSDDYLREIAGHFAAIDLPYPPPQTTGAPPALLARGEQLVRRGEPARDLPACAACHGKALMGVDPAIPGLLGLPRDYVNAQLGQWRTGQRRALEPDCMAGIARRLSVEDIGAVSAWLSSQKLPADTRPARALPQALPMPCANLGSPTQGQPAEGADVRRAPEAGTKR